MHSAISRAQILVDFVLLTKLLSNNMTANRADGRLFSLFPGSGKTSLLDVIAKRYQGQVHGSVLFNGERRTLLTVKKQVSLLAT